MSTGSLRLRLLAAAVVFISVALLLTGRVPWCACSKPRCGRG